MEDDDEDLSIAELEKELKKKKKESEIKKDIDICQLENDIKAFLKEPLLLLKHDVLEYWSKIPEHRLYNLAIILLAIPFAQVSVERLFSILKFIHNPNRTMLGDVILNDIMFLNANFKRLY